MRHRSNPLVLLIGAAIISAMLLVAAYSGTSVKIAQKTIHDKAVAASTGVR